MNSLLEYLFVGIYAVVSFFGAGTVDQISTVPSEEIYAEVVRVVDGDTIEVLIDNKRERVRYIGVDTPEIGFEGTESECFALEAFTLNQELVEGRRVRLVSDTEDRDKYERLLRYVYVEELFVNKQLIEEGMARTLTIPPNTLYYQELQEAEAIAQNEMRGRWGMCR